VSSTAVPPPHAPLPLPAQVGPWGAYCSPRETYEKGRPAYQTASFAHRKPFAKLSSAYCTYGLAFICHFCASVTADSVPQLLTVAQYMASSTQSFAVYHHEASLTGPCSAMQHTSLRLLESPPAPSTPVRPLERVYLSPSQSLTMECHPCQPQSHGRCSSQPLVQPASTTAAAFASRSAVQHLLR